MLIYESLITHFSTITSEMNVPINFHKECASRFELLYLQNLFKMLLEMCSGLRTAVQNQNDEYLPKIFVEVLRLIAKILEWPFNKGTCLFGANIRSIK